MKAKTVMNEIRRGEGTALNKLGVGRLSLTPAWDAVRGIQNTWKFADSIGEVLYDWPGFDTVVHTVVHHLGAPEENIVTLSTAVTMTTVDDYFDNEVFYDDADVTVSETGFYTESGPSKEKGTVKVTVKCSKEMGAAMLEIYNEYTKNLTRTTAW